MMMQSSTAVNTSEPLPDSSKGSNGLEATSDAAHSLFSDKDRYEATITDEESSENLVPTARIKTQSTI
jgi:hypothetical protein